MNTEQLSMLEVAIELMNQKKTPQAIMTLINEVLEIKGLDDPDGTFATQLYIDITTSSNFVFCGEGKWDLKDRQSLELFDKDGSYFNTGEEYEEEEEIDLEDYNVDDEDDDYDEDEDDEDEYDDYDSVLLDDIDPNEDDDENDFLDEQEYNDIMDDYEDMYEK
jgi:DNA-directed RNA polymerase subunit delta